MTKLSPILTHLYHTFLPLCAKSHITLDLDLPDPTISIDIDANHLTTELTAHLNAALHRTHKNDTITISATSTPTNTINISIQDTGDSLTSIERQDLTTAHTHIHSRHGYGTTITLTYPSV